MRPYCLLSVAVFIWYVWIINTCMEGLLPTITISETWLLWISAILSISIAIALKDLVTQMIAAFWMWTSPFKEGEICFLDGNEAIIVKIGWRVTVFDIHNERGQTWRYIENEMLKNHRLEKVVKKHEHAERRGSDKRKG